MQTFTSLSANSIHVIFDLFTGYVIVRNRYVFSWNLLIMS